MEQLKKQTPEKSVRIFLAVQILNTKKPTIEQLAVLNGLIQADSAVRKIVELYA